jgi:hypothetical protein
MLTYAQVVESQGLLVRARQILNSNHCYGTLGIESRFSMSLLYPCLPLNDLYCRVGLHLAHTTWRRARSGSNDPATHSWYSRLGQLTYVSYSSNTTFKYHDRAYTCQASQLCDSTLTKATLSMWRPFLIDRIIYHGYHRSSILIQFLRVVLFETKVEQNTTEVNSFLTGFTSFKKK